MQAATIIEVPPTLIEPSDDLSEVQVCEVDSWIVVEPGAGPDGTDAIVNAGGEYLPVELLPSPYRWIGGRFEGSARTRKLGGGRGVSGNLTRPAAVLVVSLGAIVCGGAVAAAGRSSETRVAVRTSVEGDTVTVECRDSTPAPEPRPNGVVGAPQPCRWVPATSADGWDPAAYGNISESGYVFFEAPGGAVGRRFPDGREEMVFNRICPDGAASGFTWVDTTVTVQDAIDDAVDRARRAVPAPTLDISPPAETGGIVNLGMWLALVAQDPITVRAEAGPHWAEATVTLASTSWAMGNGDTVTCDGPGEPIVDLDEPGEGPCGYTYRRSSPDDTPYELTVTATWEVGYRSSGPSGTAGSVDRTVSVAYDVDEIQTLGISN